MLIDNTNGRLNAKLEAAGLPQLKDMIFNVEDGVVNRLMDERFEREKDCLATLAEEDAVIGAAQLRFPTFPPLADPHGNGDAKPIDAKVENSLGLGVTEAVPAPEAEDPKAGVHQAEQEKI